MDGMFLIQILDEPQVRSMKKETQHISFQQSLDIILQNVSEAPVVYKNLHEAMDECLAEDVVADRPYPPYNRAAMDGFAIRREDFHGSNAVLPILGTQLAGDDIELECRPNTAVKVMTGAAVPDGYNAVIRFEDALAEDESVRFRVEKVDLWQNISRKGEDAKDWQKIIPKGTVLSSAAMNVAASLGHTPVQVYPKPTVSILSTGNEIVPIEQVPRPYQIRNSNSFGIRAMLNDYKIDPIFLSIVRDSREELQKAMSKGANADIMIVVGGFAKGEADHSAEILESLGVQKLFHGVQLKPGKPTWFGKKGKTAVFGLPGNPISCHLTFKVYIESYIRKYMGLGSTSPIKLPVGTEISKEHGRTELVLASIAESDDKTVIMPVRYNDSGDFISMLPSHGYFIFDSDRDTIHQGETVSFFPWKNFI